LWNSSPFQKNQYLFGFVKNEKMISAIGGKKYESFSLSNLLINPFELIYIFRGELFSLRREKLK